MTLRPVLALATSSLLLLALGGCAPATPTVSLRLWDPYVADAYRESLDRFETESGIAVEIVVVPWADYWTQLRLDIASGTVDDVFWTNAANFQDYALSDRLIPVSPDQLAAQGKDWPVSVVEQYSLESELWGVPQITDPGIALLYNADLLEHDLWLVARGINIGLNTRMYFEDEPEAKPGRGAKGGKASAKDVAKDAAKDTKTAKNAGKDTKTAKDAKDAKAAKAKATPSHPSRIWVQVLTGGNRDQMGKEWRGLVKEAAVLKGRKPYLSPWRGNFRLLTGPFESDAAAQDFVKALKKDGVSSYQWTSPAGQPVDTLALD